MNSNWIHEKIQGKENGFGFGLVPCTFHSGKDVLGKHLDRVRGTQGRSYDEDKQRVSLRPYRDLLNVKVLEFFYLK